MANGCAMRRTCYVTQKFSIMKKVIYNVSVIILLAIPCVWLVSDSLFMQAMGACYTWTYVQNILIPVFKRMRGVFFL
jgi:hypothetical protein